MKEGIFIESSMERYYISKRVVIILILFLITTNLALTSTWNIYPGGYNIKSNSKTVFLEKGNFSKEHFELKLSENNELRILLLGTKIDNLKTLWNIFIVFSGIALICLINFGNKIFLYSTLILFLFIATLTFFFYRSDMEFIDGLIMQLIRTP